MPLFLVTFGYQTAASLAAARNGRSVRGIVTSGGDDESSAQVLVEAADARSAEEWGECLALGFVRELLQDDFPGWQRHPYAVFAVPASEQKITPDIPRVSAGEHPKYGEWVRTAEDLSK